MSSDDSTVLTEEPHPSLLSSVLVIAGFITLTAIVLWGLLHVATIASPWLDSLFGTPKPLIEVTAPSEVQSGEEFAISWKHETDAEGMYTLLYQCRDNLRLETVGAGAPRVIPCGAAVTVASPEKTIGVRPMLSGTASTSVSISIVFLPNTPVLSGTTTESDAENARAEGSATVIVNPKPAATQPLPTTSTEPVARPTTPAVTVLPTNPATPPSQYSVTTTRIQAPATPPDLTVQILSLRIDPSGMGIVEFDIANVGGSTSGSYTFEVYLPTRSLYTYSSSVQSPLSAGGHIVNTLRFGDGMSGAVTIVVDPTNTSREVNVNNNITTRQVAGPTYPQSYGF